ncbi:hypothetical protein [Parachryseolinea silvisoli]|uniref:hypothetical protein n=1 Tax=Parachryseolinea silvisoli TaxID=2873601 RepID=UPI002265C8A3|nr:hypothetical protein [Parachryseolinea silvisoli]MCD9015350.1 hypothetical protein [Parachryseolinea silvisoli]
MKKKNDFKQNAQDITSKAAVTKNRFKQNSTSMGTSKAVNTAKKFAVNKQDMLGGDPNNPKKQKRGPTLTP